VVGHRPGGGRGVKHCEQVGQMEWVGSRTHTHQWQSIMWPCVARLQTVWALPWQDMGLTEISTASYLAIVLCPGLKCRNYWW
jgi:hypothetical protein